MAESEIKKENIITTGSMTLFICNFCNECYSQERSFKLHYRAHKNFTCDTCGKNFSLKRELTVHLRSHDTSKRQVVCDNCDEVFNSKLRLKMHQRTHSDDKSHVCDVCKDTFSSEIALKKHYTTHTAKETYVCDNCQASFHEKSSLQIHSCTHTGEKPSISDETVRDSKKLKRNRSIRKGREQLKCSICQKTFRSNAVLKKHRCHKGEKSRVSDISERAFNELSSSNTFPLYSAREKPHVCNLCQKAFSRKASLLSHSCTRKRED